MIGFKKNRKIFFFFFVVLFLAFDIFWDWTYNFKYINNRLNKKVAAHLSNNILKMLFDKFIKFSDFGKII